MFIIVCRATKAILGNGGRLGFDASKARGFSIEHRAEAALRKYLKVNDPTNCLGWVVTTKAQYEENVEYIPCA